MAILELDQSYETPLTEYQRGPFKLRYAYARSKDCQESGERGQDYLVWRVEPFRAAFALCDGVGQSFFGGLGSQIVGETLIQWLWDIPLDEKSNDLNELAKALRKHLDSQKDAATGIIQQKSLQSVEADIIRDALETRKEKRGTQSNFVCGCVDPSSESFPKGRVILFWLGDAKIQVWQGNDNKTTLLKASWKKEEGWSSKFGTFGEIHTFHGNLADLDCLIAHSDGVDAIQQRLSPELPTEKLQKGLSTLGEDDVSFLEIRFLQFPKDLEDDLVGTLRNIHQTPVKIVKQIEQIILPPQKIIVEVPRTPIRIWILFALGIILVSAVAFLGGHFNIPAFFSHPISKTAQIIAPPSVTNPPPISASPTVLPAFTQTPVGADDLTPTISTPGFPGVYLNSIEEMPILLAPGCVDLISYPKIGDGNFFLEVHGSFVLTGYSGLGCQGEVVIRIRDGAHQPLGGNIMSVDVVATSVLPPTSP